VIAGGESGRAMAGGAPWTLSGAKTTFYAPNMAASRQARNEGVDEAVLVSRDGFLLEAPTANLWWVRERKLFTPSLDLGILAGITRSQVSQLAGEAGIPVEEGRFTAEHLLAADEAFLTIPPVATWDRRDRVYLASVVDPKSPVAEAYRGLRTNLRFVGMATRPACFPRTGLVG